MTAPTTYCNECGASNPLQATHCFACSTALQPTAPSPLIANQAAPINTAIPASNVIGPLVPSYLLHLRYSITRQIGTGGFGAVYQAKDTLFSNRLVAIKEMSQDGLNAQELAEATAAFEREALLLADLIHPNLPRIHDHFSEYGRSYVVMDFIAGDTLEDYLNKIIRRFSVEPALEIGLQLCSVLDYLHARQPPIIFRDLKPANIMRTADNDVYLIDFGIARHFKPGKAKDTIPLGSRGYAAPEQYGKAQTTPQSDIYSLGATLHQLLTGDDPSLTPFHFAPLATALPNSSVAAQLNALLKDMLEMEMSKRPANMAVVKLKLQRLLAQQTAQKLSPSQQSSRTRIKRRNFLIGFVSVVAVCSGSSTITTYFFGKLNAVGALATHPLVGSTPVTSPSTPNATPPVKVTILSTPLYTYRGHEGSVTAVAWSPGGTHVASAGVLESSVQVWNAGTGNIILISTFEIDPYHEGLAFLKRVPALFATRNQRVDVLAWSSDSKYIAAALGNDTVQVWNLETGDATFVSSSQPGETNALAWSADGKYIAAVSGNSSVEVRSAAAGSLSLMYGNHTQTVLTLAWSPDGKLIASGSADGTVRVWSVATGNTYVTYRGHAAEVNAVAWSADSRLIASGSADGTVQVWNAIGSDSVANTGYTYVTYRDHVGSVNAVAWQPGPPLLPGQEARIASGGADATVRVWSFGTAGKTQYPQAQNLQGETLIYRGHAAPVTDVTWAPDGRRIASSSADGTVQVWQAR
jgi:serine/threonine protein kinase